MKTESRWLTSLVVTMPTIVAITTTVFVLLSYGAARIQSKLPYDKDKLLRVVQLNALPTQEVVQAIEQRGVSFQITPEVESEFLTVGARPEIIEAMRANYRPPAASGPPNHGPTTPPAGLPLSRAEIVTMLQAGTSSARVEQFVEARGVNFTLTEQISREIRAAGGNRSLLGAISEKAPGGGGTIRTPPPPKPGVGAAPDYDDLTDQAEAALSAMNPVQAVTLLQQAIKLNPSKSKAYQLLGYTQLYNNRDMASAEKSMRAAIERGGAAVFKVLHDHTTGAFTSFCQGSFFVSKSGVTFKADSGRDTFEAADSLIKEAKLNRKLFGVSPGARYNPFHITVNQPAAKSRNYNFGPRTGSEDESILIINLIGSYQ